MYVVCDLVTILSLNWGARDVIVAALSFYGDGERNGDGDSVL